jgi:hypothetical protein
MDLDNPDTSSVPPNLVLHQVAEYYEIITPTLEGPCVVHVAVDTFNKGGLKIPPNSSIDRVTVFEQRDPYTLQSNERRAKVIPFRTRSEYANEKLFGMKKVEEEVKVEVKEPPTPPTPKYDLRCHACSFTWSSETWTDCPACKQNRFKGVEVLHVHHT